VGHLSARDSMKGTLREGTFTGEPERRGFWETRKMPCKRVSLSLHRGPVGEPGGGSFAGTFERKAKCVWFVFLDLEAIKILSLGAIWNFSKGTGLSWVDIRLWATKGPSMGPRCIGQWRTQDFFAGGGGCPTNSVEDRGQRGRGSGGSSPLVRGSGDSSNLVQEI